MPPHTLDTPLGPTVGETASKALKRAFGMLTVGDLLAHYPRRYAQRGELTPIDALPVGELVTIVAEVRSASVRQMRGRRGDLVEAVISDGRGTLSLTFFGQAWRLKELRAGRQGTFSGKVGEYRGQKQLTHPDYELFDDEGAARMNAEALRNVPIPIYPATSTVASWQIKRCVDQVLPGLGDVPDPLPDEFRRRHGLLGARTALVRLHAPEFPDQVAPARETLRMHEALVLQAALLQQRQLVRMMSATARPAGALLERFDDALPFERTSDQVAVGDRISADLVGAWPMNRLVQGEVGSGKTLVALRAMLQVAQSGGQSALIAPTEVLASQHVRSIARMLGPALSPELMPTLLTGQMGAADRRKAALRVASGQALIVVGTHALLSESTTFADLGLVVVDEQHRFGVDQRETLRAKGAAPHVLVLTATPIPRTVAMTVFGDLDVSTIRTLPGGRAGISSFVAPVGEKPAWFARVWERVAEEVALGRQAFVVCPAIDAATDSGDEESAEGDEPGRTRWGVVQAAALLEAHPAFADVRVEILHGKMPGDEKDAVMQAFARGDIDVLVATTVVEVGVDVPNASTMVILEADRFGVSQLHQLRGRVGRGSIPGLCLLVTESDPGTPARQRVEAVAATTDGFDLAEVDLELRGEGDVLGDAQSGVRSSLRLLRVVADADLIAEARAEAERVLDEDPALEHHPGLAASIAGRVGQQERAALAKN
ncbi:ATP-dependent DNA helicase RecG [Microbacterium sp. EYE_5]|uniref:ATP-dependent DNA helicase RecG n=1 Tax=unclassified Microbacterium TaxID=2609290 RepID=UPI0020064563|nr:MULTISPECIES: ATP-dependent DNA helicase RecG [unclassified Microbacterium]MCK6080885.1 ATP-dependent DNA helicase RecG [Microbacterium sp. EYE_382]MCK6086156.1 ATP-dependent DNA helicase RecG [Microbacterium sp. EYE_384]MCK6124346.1 ATP-dependent DNA helicase RecG [Microbacterium sp. EYE_80]MCK6127255.1 ATP-dependent DNA helicase RecG [Microbacterium sp. EYE_79]MCK6141840.1 ATP-dependent DNA helicase RecG [Microbacterium sp. EYE_39]